MLRVSRVLGSRSDLSFHDEIHAHEHKGTVEFVSIEPADLDRRRLLAKTDKGEAIGIALPRDQKLYDGAVLFLNADRAVIVKAGYQRWLRARPASSADALELGYHAGNLHWRVRFDGADLLIALDGPADTYAARISMMTDAGRVTLLEEEQ